MQIFSHALYHFPSHLEFFHWSLRNAFYYMSLFLQLTFLISFNKKLLIVDYCQNKLYLTTADFEGILLLAPSWLQITKLEFRRRNSLSTGKVKRTLAGFCHYLLFTAFQASCWDVIYKTCSELSSQEAFFVTSVLLSYFQLWLSLVKGDCHMC